MMLISPVETVCVATVTLPGVFLGDDEGEDAEKVAIWCKQEGVIDSVLLTQPRGRVLPKCISLCNNNDVIWRT